MKKITRIMKLVIFGILLANCGTISIKDGQYYQTIFTGTHGKDLQNMIYKDYFSNYAEVPSYIEGNKEITQNLPSRRSGFKGTTRKYFFTAANVPDIEEIYNLFYKDNKIILPQNMDNQLTPKTQAIWLQFGSSYNKYIKIYTNHFTLDEIEKLKTYFENKYDFKCSIVRNKNNDTYEQNISSKSIENQRKLTLEHFYEYNYKKLGISSPVDSKQDSKQPPVCHEIIIGSLLGDGHCQKLPSGNCRIQFRQNKPNKDYLYFIYNEGFSKFCKEPFETSPSKKSVSRPGFENASSSFTFYTPAKPIFNIYHALFYNDENKRIIPKNIEEHLTARSQAIWIMDDGNKSKNAQSQATHNFHKDEVLHLISVLKNKFNLDANMQHAGDKYVIYITSRSMGILCNQVQPYFCKSMLYKLGLLINKRLIQYIQDLLYQCK